MINEFDLAFIVDTTSSMSRLIGAAQRQMVDMIDALAKDSDIDMQLGVVEYRDHPPEDTMVYRVHALTGDLQKAKKTINRLRVRGGGDLAEAVFAGIVAACKELNWRNHSRRIAVLVGDAPPHGVGARGDAFPRGCPSGETIESVAATAEENSVTLYAIGLTRDVVDSFTAMSRLTGGQFYNADHGNTAIAHIREVLSREFGELALDCKVHAAWEGMDVPTIDSLAVRLNVTTPRVASSVSRLQSRGLLTV